MAKKNCKSIFSGNRAARWAASWRSFYRKKIRNSTVWGNTTCWLLASANVGCDGSSTRHINRHVQLIYCVSWEGMKAIGGLKRRILGSAARSIPTKCPETQTTYTNFLTCVLCNFWTHEGNDTQPGQQTSHLKRKISTNCRIHTVYLLMVDYRYARDMLRCLTKYTEVNKT